MPEVFSARPVKVISGGQTYNASYRLVDDTVSVDSAYGSTPAPVRLRGRDPKAVAELELAKIVRVRR